MERRVVQNVSLKQLDSERDTGVTVKHDSHLWQALEFLRLLHALAALLRGVPRAHLLDQVPAFLKGASNRAKALLALAGIRIRNIQFDRLLVLYHAHCVRQAQVQDVHRIIGADEVFEELGDFPNTRHCIGHSELAHSVDINAIQVVHADADHLMHVGRHLRRVPNR